MLALFLAAATEAPAAPYYLNSVQEYVNVCRNSQVAVPPDVKAVLDKGNDDLRATFAQARWGTEAACVGVIEATIESVEIADKYTVEGEKVCAPHLPMTEMVQRVLTYADQHPAILRSDKASATDLVMLTIRSIPCP